MPPTGKRTCREARFDVRSRIRLGRRVTCCLSCRPRPPAGNIRRWAPCGSPWPHLVEGRYDTSSSCTPLDPAHWTHSIWQCRRNRLCRGWSHPSRHFPALPGTSRIRLPPALSDGCDGLTVSVSHLHLNSSRSRRTKPALNAFAITFDGRIVPSGHQLNPMTGCTFRLTTPQQTPGDIAELWGRRRGGPGGREFGAVSCRPGLCGGPP
jgi:hypothetical protein